MLVPSFYFLRLTADYLSDIFAFHLNPRCTMAARLSCSTFLKPLFVKQNHRGWLFKATLFETTVRPLLNSDVITSLLGHSASSPSTAANIVQQFLKISTLDFGREKWFCRPDQLDQQPHTASLGRSVAFCEARPEVSRSSCMR